jgi:hypothetical protein
MPHTKTLRFAHEGNFADENFRHLETRSELIALKLPYVRAQNAATK